MSDIRAWFSLVLLLLVFPSPVISQTCEINIDEFTGDGNVRCENWEIKNNDSDLHSNEPPNVRNATLSLFTPLGIKYMHISIRVRANWKVFYLPETAYFLIDGERKEVMVEGKNEETSSGDVVSQAEFIIYEQMADKIAGASKVRVRINKIVFDVSPLSDQIQQARAKAKAEKNQ